MLNRATIRVADRTHVGARVTAVIDRALRLKNNANSCRKILAVLGIALLAGGILTSSWAQDNLYVGDVGDNTIKCYNATNGAYLRSSAGPSAGPLDGPRGLILDDQGELLVVSQNPDLPIKGDILRYSDDGQIIPFLGALVSHDNPNAPFAPRGMVQSNSSLYVASEQGEDTIGDFGNGKIFVYTIEGKFLSNLKPPADMISAGLFHPRGLVFGPDGLLYASNWPILGDRTGNILRFNPKTGASLGIFASNTQYTNFRGPEGLVFGPDGNLYVAAFRPNTGDADNTDKILVFAGPRNSFPGKKPGDLLMKIPLDAVGQPRAIAIGLLFGPNGLLYVPIYHLDFSPGEIRLYKIDVPHNTFTSNIFVGATVSPLIAPWYLTFENTNPATLAYQGQQGQ